ncbi:MAG TPA: alpha/beta hydrolase [Solirubrobacteraceae bacterium]|nr:alpha/beta hydrolase [Solirubrobacteraceae bacterium]
MARDPKAQLAELIDWAAAAQSGPPQTHAYGEDPEQVADLLLPAHPAAGPFPVAVLLHGGFWRAAFTRSLMAALAVDLARRGWATWNVEYRRAGNGGGIPQTLDDVRAAIDQLSRLAAGLNLDPRAAVAIGHSAGAQLALCAAPGSVVTRVISLAGVCDLQAAAREAIGEDATVQFMQGGPAQRAEAYARADPLARLPTGLDDVLLVHGDADPRVPVDYSRRYAAAARAAGDRCDLLELPGSDHFDVIDPRTAVWAAVAARLAVS